MKRQYAAISVMALRRKKCTLLAGEEHHHDGYDFGILHADRSVPVSFPVVLLYGVFFNIPREKLA